MPKTILIIDDARNIRTLVSSYLQQEGYRTLTAADGVEGLKLARSEAPDLIVLDLMMPNMGGYAFLREYGADAGARASAKTNSQANSSLNAKANSPIIILTARVDEDDRVLGLELGADDYVTKPFSMRELAARVRAVLRRLEKASTPTGVLAAGDVVLDTVARSVTIAAARVDLTPTEFTLLETLISEPGRVFTRLELLERLQGNAYEGYERTIDVHIRNLRAKIEPNPRQPQYVETVYGAGYRFTPATNNQ